MPLTLVRSPLRVIRLFLRLFLFIRIVIRLPRIKVVPLLTLLHAFVSCPRTRRSTARSRSIRRAVGLVPCRRVEWTLSRVITIRLRSVVVASCWGVGSSIICILGHWGVHSRRVRVGSMVWAL